MNLTDLLIAVLTEQAKTIQWYRVPTDSKKPAVCAVFGDFVLYLTPIDDIEHTAFTLTYEHNTGDTPVFVQHEVSVKPEDNSLGNLYNLIEQ